jgi:LPS export ABC transporter protein LptC
MSGRFSALGILLLIVLNSCFKEQNIDQMVSYNGPFAELDNIETLYSDSAVLRVRLKAPKQLEMQKGDREFPKGLYIEFFDEQGNKASTLTSNKGNYSKETNLYIVRGNVIIQNIKEKKTLKTEELFWRPDTKKINTDKFVRIEGPEDIITGTGMDATQDFSSYTLHHVEGIFPVEQ